MFYRVKSRAKKEGIEFSIENIDIQIPEYCPILRNIKLNKNNSVGKFDSPSLDRIDNSKGYIKGNIQVISMKANAMKNNATLEELKMFARWVLKNEA
jgi:hypothetical protein